MDTMKEESKLKCTLGGDRRRDGTLEGSENPGGCNLLEFNQPDMDDMDVTQLN
jgi:hypothetical protein